MASFAPNTYQGAFGQANAVPQQQTAPFTPYDDEPSYKPADRRYFNMATGGFFDAIVRGMFGFHPDPLGWPAQPSAAALQDVLLRPRAARGFHGTLSNLRTPFGMAAITSGTGGLSIHLLSGK